MDAAKKGNQADVDKYNKDWHRNADDIVQFLSGINPNWPAKELKDLFYTHLQSVAEDLNARLRKDWDAGIIAFDKGINHLLQMSDFLTQGIIKQFPDKFK